MTTSLPYSLNHNPKYLNLSTTSNTNYSSSHSKTNSVGICDLPLLNTTTLVFSQFIFNPSYLQNLANSLKTRLSTSTEGANTIASSAKSNNHIYTLSIYTNPGINLPLVCALSSASTLAYSRSKKILKSCGLQGQPYFKPIRISIRLNFIPLCSIFTFAFKSTYRSLSAFTSPRSSYNSSNNTYHNRSRITESYALRKSINTAYNFYPIAIAR